MRILIVEDDFISRNMLHHMLSDYGHCDIAVNGQEAVGAFKKAWEDSMPYDLICMDIMMPVLNGLEALIQMREFEKQMNLDSVTEAKIIMITALDDKKNMSYAFYKGGVSAYLVKPIDKKKLIEEIKGIGLLKRNVA